MGDLDPGRGEGSTALVCVGRAVPGHEVQVVDEKGRAIPPGEVGHLIVRGPSVMQGYCGFHDAEGGLYIAGRAKDLIIIRGKNYYAEDVERVIERLPGVRAGGAVAFAIYDEE